MARLGDVQKRLQALRDDESGEPAPATPPPPPERPGSDEDVRPRNGAGGTAPLDAPPARSALSWGDDPLRAMPPVQHDPHRTDVLAAAPLEAHERSPRLERDDETIGLPGSDEPHTLLDDENGVLGERLDEGDDSEQQDEDQSAPPAPRSPLLRYPRYSDLVRLQDLIARKRESLRSLVQECRGFGLTTLARESGLSVRTLQRLAGPPRRTLSPPDLARAALCVRELRAYRSLLDRRSALLERMRREARRARAEGAGLRRIERLLGAPSPTGVWARRLMATTHRRPWPDEVPHELRERYHPHAALAPTTSNRTDDDSAPPERDEGG
jgi:hypothetical protein